MRNRKDPKRERGLKKKKLPVKEGEKEQFLDSHDTSASFRRLPCFRPKLSMIVSVSLLLELQRLTI